MKVLIIEDEAPAAEKLQRYLKRYDETIEVLAVLSSIEQSVQWFEQNGEAADLIFMDIQLTDGKSLDVFKEVRVDKPIIFTTAYSEYAIEAFKLNGLDYLLKPVFFDQLKASLDRVLDLGSKLPDAHKQPATPNALAGQVQAGKTYKSRFLVKTGDHIKSIPTKDIALFYAEGRTAYLVKYDKKKYIVDYKLETLEDLLNPQSFFRVNRTYILNIEAIADTIVYSNSRLKVMPTIAMDKEIIVSRDKVIPFKNWINDSHE